MIRRLLVASGAAAASVVSLRFLTSRGAHRLLAAPRVTPAEADLTAALDALGGEVVRLRSRDGLRLTARWLPAEMRSVDWIVDPHEAVLLLHGWSGSIAPDIVEYGPFLRRTAGLLGLDFRGHGGSEESPTTFGMREIEDVAGALAWLGERGIERVALVGTSMGGMTAIASVAVLGDGTFTSVDADPAAPAGVPPPARPRIVGVVADSVAPELVIPVANRLRGPARRFVAARLFDGAARMLGGDPRATEPIRMIGLVDPVPLLLIHGAADEVVPVEAGHRLAAAAGPACTHWVVPGARHSAAHATDASAYERRVTEFLRAAFAAARADAAPTVTIIAAPEGPSGDAPDPAPVED